MQKIILCTKPDETQYSVESGLHDGVKHFDHHGKFSNNKAVCVMDIKPAPDNAKIYITHVDADTLKAVAKLIGMPNWAKEIDWVEVGIIDSYSPEYMSLNEKGFKARQFMIGVSAIAKYYDIPRSTEKEVDITDKILKIFNTPIDLIIAQGKDRMEASRKNTQEYVVKTKNGVALVKLPEKANGIDTVLLYQNGISTIVMWGEKYKNITLFGSNKITPCPIIDLRGEWAGVKFAGHPHACGIDPRGTQVPFEKAEEVFEAIAKELENKK